LVASILDGQDCSSSRVTSGAPAIVTRCSYGRTKKPAPPLLPRDIKLGILANEHVAEDGSTVLAFRLGAEGIVSKRIDGTYRSGPCSVWIKVRNPASIAVQRERSEKWNS
jgi:hypothetical protein